MKVHQRLNIVASLLAAALLLGFTANASAQADNADSTRVARQREALRRSQEALKLATEQQAQLLREKTQLASDKVKLDDASRRQGAQLGGLRSEVVKLRSDVARMTAELDAERRAAAAVAATAAANQQAAAAQATDLSQRLAKTERELRERTQTLAAMSALTERSSKALLAAEVSNRQMHAWGLQLIEQLRATSRDGTLLGLQPAIGFAEVRLENEAEALRDKLDALKVPTPPALP